MSKQRVPYFCWRNGRPRWVPGPALRARGHHGQDLKDADGRWLSRGAAIDAAEKLNAALKSSPSPLAGEGVASTRSVHGATEGGLRTVSALCTAYERSPHFTRRLAKRTRRGYALHLKIIRDTFGDIDVRQLSKPDLAEFHAALEEGHGAAQANAVMRTTNIVLNYAGNDLHWLSNNPAKGIEFADTPGRLMLLTPEEITALVNAADALDLHSIGDAVIMGVLTVQRQGDVLTLCDTNFRDGKFVFKTSKTGRLVKVPATAPLQARIEAMRARKAKLWPNVTHTAEIVCELTGAPYLADGSRFREMFRMVRAVAAGAADARDRVVDLLGEARAAALDNLLPTLATAPTVLEKRFADLRDTGVTWLFIAGCTVAEIATITGHSLRTVQDILDKHYFVRDDALAASAALKFDAFLKTQARW